MIPNQSVRDKSWVSYFLGQYKRIAWSYGATINLDGTVTFHGGNNSPTGTFAPPSGDLPVIQAMGNPCWGGGSYDGVRPIYTNAGLLNGEAPISWEILVAGTYGSVSCHGNLISH